MCKQMSSGLFKMSPTNILLANHIYIYIYKQSICHKTTQTKLNLFGEAGYLKHSSLSRRLHN